MSVVVTSVDYAYWSGRLSASLQAVLGELDGVPREIAERHAREVLAELKADRERFIHDLEEALGVKA